MRCARSDRRPQHGRALGSAASDVSGGSGLELVELASGAGDH